MTEEKKGSHKSTTRAKTGERTYTRLFRSETNRMIAGVAGGLAAYFTIDPVFVRIAFVLLALFHGSGILIYFILWLILPTESRVEEYTTINKASVRSSLSEVRDQMRGFSKSMHIDEKNNTKMILGAIIIILGILFLLDNFGLGAWIDLGRLWPVILIAIGVAMVF
jgi:phage shock protein PspC (stress-responsive transcriptional regulator)